MDIAAVVIAILALLISGGAFYYQHLQRFTLECFPMGIFVLPPDKTRPHTAFDIAVPMVVRNGGARAGAVRGAYLRLLGPSDTEFRLDAGYIATVYEPFYASQAARSGVDLNPENVIGIGGLIPLAGRETKAVSVTFRFPPDNAMRWHRFGRPVDRFKEGDYLLEVWLSPSADKWKRFRAGQHLLTHERLRATPLVLVMGDLYDRAPGGPANSR